MFNIFSAFANDAQIEEMKEAYQNGIGWGDAKNIVFNQLNEMLIPIREKYNILKDSPSTIEDILINGANKVRPQAIELLNEIKDKIGIRTIT